MKMLFIAVAASLLSLSAFAKAAKPAPAYHCMKDGAELAGKNKKSCKKEGGMWEKVAPAEGAAEAPKADDKK